VGMLYKKFVSQFGSADCIDILGKVSRSKNMDSCEEVARSAAQLALDLMSVKTFTFPYPDKVLRPIGNQSGLEMDSKLKNS
jgi:hypothetical protein